MACTFSQYVARYMLPNDEKVLLEAVADWMAEVEGEYLAEAPQIPMRELLLASFRRDVGLEMRFINRTRGAKNALLVTPINIKTRLDRVVNQRLNAHEAILLSIVVLPSPKLSHHHEYTTPGVACTGALIDSNGALSGTWANITTYSGNHDSRVGYIAGGGGSKRTVAKPIPAANWNMIKVAKPGLADVKCLGDDRHAEDGWFAYHYDDFVKAAKALAGIMALPQLSKSSLLAQAKSRPRIEFLMSMPPCSRDDVEPNSGCVNYFAALRKAVGDRLPIVLYCYRPFEADQGKMRVYTIDAAGQRVSHPNTWLQG